MCRLALQVRSHDNNASSQALLDEINETPKGPSPKYIAPRAPITMGE